MSIQELSVEEVETMQLPPVPATGFHYTRGVYASGNWKCNGVAPEHLRDHLRYNLAMRPGRAFFVDGKCVNRGYLSEAQCLAIEQDIGNECATRCTAPYH